MRVAAIDLGSNSFHMLVAEVRGASSFETVLQEKMMIQLGRTALVSGRLDPDTIRKGLRCLDEFRRLAFARRVDRILAVATSAIREAENGDEFLRRAREELGLPVRVISGREEARLIHLAVSRHGDLGDRKAVLVDIGGGGIELTVGDAARVYYSTSQKAGFLRLHGRFVTGDPIKKREQKALAAYLKDLLAAPLARMRRHAPERVIATGGSVAALLRLVTQRRGENPSPPGSADCLGRSELRSVLRDMLGMKMVDRTRKFDLGPLRAAYLPTASLCLEAVLDGLGCKEVHVCPVALREGIIHDFLSRVQLPSLAPAPPGDLRLRSVLDLAGRCDYPVEHSHQVAKIAVQIFRQIPHLHGLGDQEAQLLHYAAVLHDIGYYIGYARHHRHAYYLIMNCDLRGFAPEERNTLANLVRHHRRATPRKSHACFAVLPAAAQKTVKRLAAILRLADAMDRSHFSLVRELRCRPGRGRLRLELVTAAGPSAMTLDLDAAQSAARYFEKIFGVKVAFALVKAAK